MLHRLLLLLACCALLVTPATAQHTLELAFPNLTFGSIVDIQHAGDGTDRLFVVELPGLIYTMPNEMETTDKTTFLDLRSNVLSNDRFGMFGLAFHPNYATNGYFYVHYTASGPDRSVIARFSVHDTDPNQGDPASEVVLLEVNQPHKFHNGGQLAFGPDGYLYIILGDGGPGADPNGHGQDRTTLLGAMLRIDVDNPDPGLQYGIPSDNPFAGNTDGFREEIWAWGLRNTWRFSFDPVTGWLWGAENGEDRYEEINLIEKGKNYGWKITEGNHCFSPSTGCDMTAIEMPIFEYGGTPSRRSSIGGFVYRGRKNPELVGKYIYADYLFDRIWALEYDGVNPPVNTELATQGGTSTFGLDEQGELLIGNLNEGRIYRFAPTSTAAAPQETPPATLRLAPNYPNPFRGMTTIQYHVPRPAYVTLSVYDLLGRQIHVLVSEEQPAGMHTARWQGTDAQGNALPAGHYFYHLEAAGLRTIGKMVWLGKD